MRQTHVHSKQRTNPTGRDGDQVKQAWQSETEYPANRSEVGGHTGKCCILPKEALLA
ncbi:MAG: hypothetical protein ISS63_03355 [Desulfobacteraceae bacterium]|nr:hypothetical protein [Desulfobacteraceae bacterium]